MVGLTAIVGLLYGEGAVTAHSSSPLWLFRRREGPLLVLCALSGWKQFLQEPGFHTCSAKSLQTDIFDALGRVWSEEALE